MACVYQKVLVLGHCLNETGIYSFKWSELPEDLNLADFDLVIFDFSVLKKETTFSLDKIYTFNLWNLVFNSSAEVVIIGSPERITTNSDSAFSSYFSPLSLLPLSLKWSGFSGDKLKLLDPTLEFYFKSLKRWSFHFDFASEDDKYKIEEISEALRKNIASVKVAFKAVAKNGYGRLLSSRFKFSAIEWSDESKNRSDSSDVLDKKKNIDSALFLWLPPVDEDSEKMVRLLLRKLYNIEEISSKPGWVNRYTLPDIRQFNDKLRDIDETIAQLEGEKKTLCDKKISHEEIEGILYRREGARLTAGVALALTELGCRVIGPACEEGGGLRFVDPNNIKWLVSICADKAEVSKKDIRQIDSWIKNNIIENEWTGFGAIVGNYQYQLDPQKRSEGISTKSMKILNRFGLFILTTKELFEALLLSRKGELNPESFWNNLAGRGRLFD